MYVMIDGSCIQYGQAVLKVYAVRVSLLAIRHDLLSLYERTVTISRVRFGLGLVSGLGLVLGGSFFFFNIFTLARRIRVIIMVRISPCTYRR